MFDPSVLTDNEFQKWMNLRQSLATGMGVKRNPRAALGFITRPSYAAPGRLLLRASTLSRDHEDGENYVRRLRNLAGHVKTIINVPEHPHHTHEIDMHDYRRVQLERWDIEKKYWPGWTAQAVKVMARPDRFRTFDPTPAYEHIVGHSYRGDFFHIVGR